MALYTNSSAGAPVQSVAFQTVDGNRQSFIQFSKNATDADIAQVRSWLGSTSMDQSVLSQTASANGVMLVTRGDKTPQEFLSAFAAYGQNLAIPTPEKEKFNPWKWRGITSIIGQTGQLFSGYFSYEHAKEVYNSAIDAIKANGDMTVTKAKEATDLAKSKLSDAKGDAVAVVGFAALNFAANVINIAFGKQEKPDPHQLRYLKSAFNKQLEATGVATDALPNVEEHQLAKQTPPKKTLGEQGKEFLNKYSVSFGEIFLRTLGSFNLSFPVTRWAKAFSTVRTQGFLQGFKELKNQNNATFIYGLLMLTGKGTSFLAKEPDPYNPDPPSAWNKFREDWAFKLSSVIEGLGAVWSTQDRLLKQKMYVHGHKMPDYFGAVGNAVFVGGYGIRYTAPYGSLEVDKPELYAHMAAGLAKLPEDKLPAAIAETAQWLTGHFKDKTLDMPTIYGALVNELKAHHHREISVPAEHHTTHAALATAPTSPTAKVVNIQAYKGPEVQAPTTPPLIPMGA